MNFQKWQGTGNDFIFIHDPLALATLTEEQIAFLCHRRFGIGADGLILWQVKDGMPFMKYFNSDGKASTMCGNGGRCFAAYALHNKLISEPEFDFYAVDGLHHAAISETNNHLYQVELHMIPVSKPQSCAGDLVLQTGSPHYVRRVDADFLNQKSIITPAQQIRFNERFAKEGINVNFVEWIADNKLRMRTYERGVEDETYSCGTGVTAAAIASFPWHLKEHVLVQTQGGQLEVRFQANADGSFDHVRLIGPAAFVFSGEISL